MAAIGKYTPELVESICAHLRGGMNRTDTCLLVGISGETFYAWMKQKVEFSDAVQKSEAECKARNIHLIQKAAIKTWQAAAWWLERKYNKEFAVNQIQSFQIADGNELTDDRIADLLARSISNLPDDKRQAILIGISEQKPQEQAKPE